MLDSSSILGLTEGFYGAALGLGSWSAALERLSDSLRADHVALHAETASPFTSTARIDERDLQRAMSAAPEVWADAPPTEAIRSGEAERRSALIRDPEYRRTAHYNEVVRPMGGFHAVFGKATAAAAGSSLILCRAPRRVDFSEDDIGALTALMPHVSLAVAIGARIDSGPALPRSEAALLEAFRGAAIICDGAARLLSANHAARVLLETNDGIGLRGGRLAAMNTTLTPYLRDAVAAAAFGDDWGQPQSLRVRLERRPGRLALSLRLVPVGSCGAAVGDPRTVAIFVTEPDATLPLDRDAVAEAFGLAPREAEVACMLACGASLAGIAADTGLKMSSVRAYLRNVFDKTDARSQAALVARLRGFV
jgi:DNA-binding CsgD family transcriptional regulator